MVLIHIKHNDQSQFLFETTLKTPIEDFVHQVTAIFNGRLKIDRICGEMEELANHGTMYPPEILGLNEDQVEDFKLIDTWGNKCVPSGGFMENKDPVGRRNGRQPKKEMQEVLRNAIKDARQLISKNLVNQDQRLNMKAVQQALDLLKGAVMIVYPMKLSPHDVIRTEFENVEDLRGTQASLQVIDPATAQVWFCGKEMYRENKTLADYLGRIENCKVIVKLAKRGHGAPAREPVFTEEERKAMMLHAYRKQEELKKLETDDDDSYLDSAWADGGNLKRSFHGMEKICWKPGKF